MTEPQQGLDGNSPISGEATADLPARSAATTSLPRAYLRDQRVPSPQAKEVLTQLTARLQQLNAQQAVLCAWIIDVSLPPQAGDILPGCCYSLRGEVFHWLQAHSDYRRRYRIVSEHDYRRAAKAGQARPLEEVLRMLGVDPRHTKPKTVKRRQPKSRQTPGASSVVANAAVPGAGSASAVEIPVEVPKPEKDAPGSGSTRVVNLDELPGRTPQVLARRSELLVELRRRDSAVRVNELCQKAGDLGKRAVQATRQDLQALVEAGLVDEIRQHKACLYRARRSV